MRPSTERTSTLGAPRWWRRLTAIVGWLVVLVCLGLAAVPLAGQVAGSWRLLPVLSDSMAPAMTRGDLAWVVPKPLPELRVGDVLVFNSPRRGSTPSKRVIHRVIELVDPGILRPEDVTLGAVYVRTKGDANPQADPWIAAISDESVWVRTRVVPELGRPLLAAGSRSFRVLAPLTAAALIASWGVATLLRGDSEAPASRRKRAPVSRPSPRRPLVLRTGVVGVAALGVGMAGIASAVTAALSDYERNASTIGAGAVRLGTGTSTLDLVVADLLPGERSEWVFDLANTGSLSLGSLELATTSDSRPLLDPTDGLQLAVDRCPEPWQTGPGPDRQPSAQCSSPPNVIVADRPLSGRTLLDRDEMAADSPDGVDHLRVTIRLSDAAPAALAGQLGTVTLTFSGGQRSGRVA